MAKRKHIPTLTERRWALAIHFDFGWRFLGRYCWRDGKESEPRARTFRTRAEARLARKKLRSYVDDAKIERFPVVVPVELITREVTEAKVGK